MSSNAAAQLLSVTLYYRRFFPYYAFNLIAGLDENGYIPFLLFLFVLVGKGAVYGYDAVGSFKRDDYGAMGSGQNFIMPILDNLVSLSSRRLSSSHPPAHLRSVTRIAVILTLL
jgi:20S proteasome subunit beta 6